MQPTRPSPLSGTDEAAHLAALVEAARRSARLHAQRADKLRLELDLQTAQLRRVQGSSSWRITRPLRGGLIMLRLSTRAVLRSLRQAARRKQVSPSAPPVAHWWHRSSGPPKLSPTYLRPPALPAPAILVPRVLIVAELSIPQCAKYRVWQKQELLRRLGVAATVVDWRDTWRCLSALQLHARLILYRVPATPEIRGLLQEAARLGVATAWEVDDLIFDERLYLENSNLRTLDPALRREVLSGIAGYRAGLLATDTAIASTAPLAAAMRNATNRPVAVVENALDDETLATAAALRSTRRPSGDGTILVAYGSGTKTHDVDILEAADALAELLRLRPAVRLRIMGELTMPTALAPYAARIEQLPPASFPTYLARLAQADISIAPLEPGVFNDAKSNIKFLEAAILAMPSVCSPRACFRAVIEHGRNGLLAGDQPGWLTALLSLVDDPALRHRLGSAALATALARYAPAAIAAHQLAPLVQGLDQRPPGRLRILVVNVFYAPQSFGGATIVAEQLTRRLAARPDTEAFVFTTHQLAGHPSLTLLRYEAGGVPVIAARQPPTGDRVLEFDSPLMAETFQAVLAAIGPDIVHFHCVQHISASCADACRDLGIPYIVTLHDAWWLCQRQFMVTGEGRYCHQWQIDLTTCERCIPGAFHLRERFAALRDTLRNAALLTTPSEFHRRLHLANGHTADHIVVNRNGVRMPAAPRPPRQPGPLRFGFVGGNEVIKGIEIVREAFAGLASSAYELVLVDNTLNLGFSTWRNTRWRLPGRVRIVPPYDSDTMDAFFASIDVLLFPSQWKESFGLTVREAMARDVWVIATDAGGVAEDLVDGVNGTVIPMDGDPAPLRAAIADLLARPERLASYRNPYKDRIANFDDQAEQMWQLLAGIAHGPPETSSRPAA